MNRATTEILQSIGSIEKTVDKDFDEEEKRYRALEAKVEKLHRESKGYLDSKRIAETIDHFYDQGAPLGYAGLQYKEAIEKLDEECRNELDNSYRITVLEPLGKLIQVFPDFNEAIKKRQKKLLDYDQVASKSRKLADKPSNDPNAYPAAQAATTQAKEVYDGINNTLMTEIPKLIELRIPYLDPSFEALVKSQLAFNRGANEKFESIKSSFGVASGGSLDGQVEGVLAKMKELSICGSS